MKRSKAIEVLRDYNDYRRNKGIYDVDEPCCPKYTAKEIGEAIDAAIGALVDSDGIATVLDAIKAETGVGIDEIRSECRDRELVIAREVAASLLRRQGYTLAEVGDMINRSHSNVMHLVDEADYWQTDKDRFYRELRLLRRVKERLGMK